MEHRPATTMLKIVLEIILAPKTQLPQTTEDNISCDTKETIQIRFVCFENTALKKSGPISY